jgi:DNA primase
MASIDYAAVRQRIAVPRVLDLIEYRPTVIRGDQWRGPCPIAEHASTRDRDRCFSVNLSRNVFRCFRCGRSGNQLDLWAAITQQPLYPATVDLCQRLGVEIPPLPPNRNSKTSPP